MLKFRGTGCSVARVRFSTNMDVNSIVEHFYSTLEELRGISEKHRLRECQVILLTQRMSIINEDPLKCIFIRL